MDIFQKTDLMEMRFIVSKMNTVIYLPNDEVIKQGNKGTKVYFLCKGEVDVFIKPEGIIFYKKAREY